MEEFYIDNVDLFGDNLSEIEKKQFERKERKENNKYQNNKLINKEKTNKRVKTRNNEKKKKEEIKLEHKKLVENMSKEEKDIFYQQLRDEKKKLKETLKVGLTSNFIIVFDLFFNSSMGYNELKSLIIQLGYCYSINKKNKKKISFFFTNYNGYIKEELEKMGSNFWYSHFENEEFFNVEELIKLNKEFIYLSPDSNEELNDVSEDKIYIIGGLVDKPVMKDKTLLRVSQINNESFIKEKGIKIKTAKLPLFKYLNNIANPVLNLNTVVEILSNYMDMEIKDWEKAIKFAIPQRNLKKDQ